MKFIHKFLNFFEKVKSPRYHLSLDSHYYSLTKKCIVYRFKIYGEHAFPKFTFDDIKNDKNLMYDINPVDLMQIAIDNYLISQSKSMLKITEILRDNKYKLSNENASEILSGDEVCDNILLIEKIKKLDLYKIAYNTGFNHGKQLARDIIKKVSSLRQDLNTNVISLKVLNRNNAKDENIIN